MRILFLFSLLALLGSASPAFAHGDLEPGANPWLAWSFAPEIIGALVLAAAIYIAGMRHRPKSDRGADGWRHAAFFGGLFALYLALQSPIEPIADHVFIVHQVEHMLLRTIGPMLIMLAVPQAVLMRGLPAWARRRIVAPTVASRPVRAVFGVLANPAVATALFIAASYFWMVPRYHDLAILDEPIHYTWHVTLLLSGLIFFWRVFDARPYPLGLSLPARLLMFWFAAMGNIFLGVYLSFKSDVLYTAYDTMGRLWGLDALTDERFGGLTMWIPGCMMIAMAGLIVVHRWARDEHRADARRLRSANNAPLTAGEQRILQAPKNRALAMGLVGFVAVVIALAISAALIFDRGAAHLL